ncbi:aldose epimerase family protein [Mobiluncus mulieris]|uniref:Aldose 1-epimerase n=1 Tax=Mobiluncus mulieris TaxID=2052 RepID=A0A8G2M5L3_9ACTO|nr:aldose epimerase family protein [Mobiluncus mulieris]STO15499.1 Aldose 1-epimerase precursor [Mobiluncus mulieris]
MNAEESCVSSRYFGRLDEQAVHAYTIRAKGGLTAEILDWGAALNSVRLCGNDSSSEVAVGFDTVENRKDDYFGAIIGRVANRIKNGHFSIDGQDFQVATNEYGNTLHGGSGGFCSRIWRVTHKDPGALTLALTSPDGDQGFPGEVDVTAIYRVEGSTLSLNLTATTTAPTVLSLTNHVYWNLAGGGSIDNHELLVEAEQYLPIDAQSIPVGEIASVAGTPFDLRKSRLLGSIVRDSHPQIGLAHGIDHSFCIRGSGLRRCARLVYSDSGRALEIWSDLPAVQVYTGNSLDATMQRVGGQWLRQGDAIAIEPGYYPDSPHHPTWPDITLRPGQQWQARIEWRFEVEASL